MKTSSSMLPIAASLLIAACNSDSVFRNDVLTRDEAAALMRATNGQIGVVAESQVSGQSSATASESARLDRAAVSITQTFGESVPCENGRGRLDVVGAITVTGEADAPTGLEMSATITPRSCAVITETGDIYEINGDPNLAVQLSLPLADGLPVGSMTETVRGRFTWVSGSRSGRCSVDLTYEMDVALNRVHTRGTFCGIDVDEVETL